MSKSIKTIKEIGILGGGISGLSSAYFLSKKFPDARIDIIEKDNLARGALSTKMVGNDVFDLGPRSIKNSK